MKSIIFCNVRLAQLSNRWPHETRHACMVSGCPHRCLFAAPSELVEDVGVVPDLGERREGNDRVEPSSCLVVGLSLLLCVVVQLHLHLRRPGVQHMLVFWRQSGLQDAVIAPVG